MEVDATDFLNDIIVKHAAEKAACNGKILEKEDLKKFQNNCTPFTTLVQMYK